MRRRNLSTADLARYIGVSRQYMHMIRHGDLQRPDAGRAAAIEMMLGFDRGELFDYDDDAPVDRTAS